MVKENETYGIYTVIKETSEKNKYKHKLYEVKCNVCGKTFIKPANKFAAPSTVTNFCKHLNAEELAVLALEKWKSEKHICKVCGKVMTEKFGSGVYCSRSCSNKRERPEEVKLKISQALVGKKAYINTETNKIKYFRPDEITPEGYIKTFSKLKSKCNPSSGTKTSYTFNRYKDYISNKKLLELCKEYVNEHNTLVLNAYEQLLKDKSINKEFVIPDNAFMFAKYLSVTDVNHPRGHEGHVFIHILLAETLLSRGLTKEEIVHHKNRNKLDNRFDNIYIFDTQASHARFHYATNYWLTIKDDVLVCDAIDMVKLRSYYETQNPPDN